MASDESVAVGGKGNVKVLREIAPGQLAEQFVIEGDALDVLKSIGHAIEEIRDMLRIAFESTE